MLASSGTVFDDDSYLFEVKWNGIRMLAFLETSGYRLVNRHGIDTTSRYPEFAFLAGLPPGTLLDGEMVVFRAGQPDLALLQGRDKTRSALKTRTLSQAQPATYLAFDLLYEKFVPLLDRPLVERRQRLECLLQSWSHPRLVLSQGIQGQGRLLFAQTCRQNLEGIMAKRLASPYRPGKRGADWIKIKRRLEMLGVIIGFTPRGTRDFANLIVAAEDAVQVLTPKSVR
jgi:ATP-dependent DNA ligase